MLARRQNVRVEDVPTLPELYNPSAPLQWPLKRLEMSPNRTPAMPPNAAFNAIIGLINADVTSMTIDAIVNAANERLAGGGGIDGAIHARAGDELSAACKTFPILHDNVRCPTGQARVTDSFKLPCRKIIHTPGPVWTLTQEKAEAKRLLCNCYHNSLDAAVENGCRSIVFPPISTGIFGYPNQFAADDALSAVRAWLQQQGEDVPMDKIVFSNIDQRDMEAYLLLIPRWFPPVVHDETQQGQPQQGESQHGEPHQVEPQQAVS
ncbi:hypothetical protein IWX49DRAFT_617866 [Phyllosticta citricarpa]|uniref:Macro domain-containing protein n=2 Tax=Phyllosticta TaxID=121621 RepID=A0ABR1MGU2_9PEZI